MNFLIAWLFSLRMSSIRLDVSVQYCLELWRNVPAVVIVLEDRENEQSALIGRINQMYPF